MSGGRRGLEATLAGIDGQRAIHANVELDPSACITDAMGVGFQLDAVIGQRDGVVGRDDAIELKDKHGVRIKGSRQITKGGAGLGGRDCESFVEVGEKGIEECLGLLECRDLVQTQFTDEAVLEGTEESFDASFGLGGPGGNGTDVEFG